MTKQQFTKQSVEVAPLYPVDQFGDIYDRIQHMQFKTDTQDIEQVFERIRPFFSETSNQQQRSLTVVQRQVAQQSSLIKSGDSFVKYGRYGTPHIRFVYISQDEKYLVWCVKNFEIGHQQLGEQVMQGVESKVKRILLRDIIDVRTGVSGSPVLKKY